MHTIHRRAQHSAIPAYSENAVLQLIIASGVTFIVYHFTRIIMLVAGVEMAQADAWMQPNTALPALEHFAARAWTIFTYGWVHDGFWEWLTNMIWFYCFGSILQSLAGYRQLIPLYILALTVGGMGYLAGQAIPSPYFAVGNTYFTGAQAAVTAMAIGALALAPKHRMYLSPQFNIPLIIIVAVYLLLNLVVILPERMDVLMVHVGGALAGLFYAWRLKAGDRPGNWIYNTLGKVERIATPNEEKIAAKRNRKRNEVLRNMYEAKSGLSQQRIDEILDKINDRGYSALSREEKDLLLRAGKE